MLSETAKQLLVLAKKYKNEMLFIPIGGVDEIGMNAYLYHYANRWVLIDAGIGFADYRMPGVDTLLPDLTFMQDFPLDAVLLTHPHEDHIGGIAELLKYVQAPIYMGEFTAQLVRHKLYNFNDRVKIHMIVDGVAFKIGKLTITPCGVAHSVPEAFAFFFETEFGLVVHSGDWKYDFDPVIGKSFAVVDWQLCDKKIKAMICDSTNIMSPGDSGSESDVAKPLQELIAECAGHRIFITCFASNVARLSNIMHALHQAGRKILLMGRAMQRMHVIGSNMGWFHDLPVCSEEQLDEVDMSELAIIITGSQGEGRSMLAKISRNEHKKIYFRNGDKVFFSSRTIPGNEISISEVQNQIARQGGEVVNVADHQIHVSGHYQRAEIDATYDSIKPEWVIPVHGEPRHLRAHCKIVDELGMKSLYMPGNGSIAVIGKADIFLAGSIDLATQMVEASGRIITHRDEEFQERKKVIWNGALVMAFAISRDDDSLQSHPQITPIGLGIDDHVLEDIEDKAAEIYRMNYQENISLEETIEKMKSLMRKESRIILKKRPVVAINLLMV